MARILVHLTDAYSDYDTFAELMEAIKSILEEKNPQIRTSAGTLEWPTDDDIKPLIRNGHDPMLVILSTICAMMRENGHHVLFYGNRYPLENAINKFNIIFTGDRDDPNFEAYERAIRERRSASFFSRFKDKISSFWKTVAPGENNIPSLQSTRIRNRHTNRYCTRDVPTPANLATYKDYVDRLLDRASNNKLDSNYSECLEIVPKPQLPESLQSLASAAVANRLKNTEDVKALEVPHLEAELKKNVRKNQWKAGPRR